MPMVAGTLSKVEVQSGAKVEAGQVLALLDDASERIAVNVAKLALSSAQEKVDRYQGLKATLTRVEIDEAQRALDEAKLTLETAELNLSRKIITAPISGITGIVTVNPGDNVTTQTQIATIDDRSEVLVDFWVPERFASTITVGAPVDAAAISRPGEVHKGIVEAVDNRIDAASRTIRVRAKIPNPDDRLRAGMSFTVSMRFSGESYPAVDPLSVQWDSKGSYVWRVKEGKAERVAVKIVQRNPENVLVDGPLAQGDMIVSEGMQRVRSGATLTASNVAPGGAS
jgi:RND family efflux transporter MFP subunit